MPVEITPRNCGILHHVMEVFIAILAFSFAASIAVVIFATLPRT